MNEITRVTYRWDAQKGVEPGWYVQAWAGERWADDSQKVSFPVDVDEIESERELRGALAEAFPGAEIVDEQGQVK